MKICKKGHERLDEETRCKVCHALTKKIYQENNKEARKEYLKKYTRENKELISKRNKDYQNKNRKKLSAYEKAKRNSDPIYKLKRNLRTRLRSVLKGKYKSGSAVQDLGCTGDELKIYLETLFEPGMSWDNYGNKQGQWSIDHIIPLSKVDLTNQEELFKVCHYTNLKPMWHQDNLKKSNKYNSELDRQGGLHI